MNINQYKPKYGQDPQLFNDMYMDYIEKLNSADVSEPDTPTPMTHNSSTRPYSQQSSQGEEDKDDDDDT